MLAGFDVKLTVLGPEITETVTDWTDDAPPVPKHWNVNVVCAVIEFVRPWPFRELELLHGPPALQ